MPLDPLLLTKLLVEIDATPPQSPAEAAQRWTDALVKYAAGMLYLVPGAAMVGRPALLTALTPAFLPISTWPLTVSVIEAALRVYWPLVTIPGLTTLPGAVYTPSPLPLSTLLLPVPATGIMSQQDYPPRAAIATIVDAWTRSNSLTAPGPVVTPFV